MTDFTGAQIFSFGSRPEKHSVSKVLSNNFLNCDFSHNAYQRYQPKRPFAGCNARKVR
jgi:hypothetical protein